MAMAVDPYAEQPPSDEAFRQVFTSFDDALRETESILQEQQNGPATLVIDLDGVFNNDDFLFDAMALKLYEERLNRLKSLLESYPNLNVVVVTARLDVYQWRDWIGKLESVLGADGVKVQRYSAMKKPEYDELFDRLRVLQNGSQRIVVTNVAKKRVIRYTGRMFCGGDDQFKLPEDPLGDIFKDILNSSSQPIIVLDDGAMWGAVSDLLKEETDVHYLELQLEAKKTKGLFGAVLALLALYLSRKVIRNRGNKKN